MKTFCTIQDEEVFENLLLFALFHNFSALQSFMIVSGLECLIANWKYCRWDFKKGESVVTMVKCEPRNEIRLFPDWFQESYTHDVVRSARLPKKITIQLDLD